MGQMTYGEVIDTERGRGQSYHRIASSLRDVFGDNDVAEYRMFEDDDGTVCR